MWVSSGFSENGAYEVADGHASTLDTGSVPEFLLEPKDPKLATYNVTVDFTAVVQDADNDVLNVTWDWGDGSVNVTTTTSPTYPYYTIKLGHVYAPDPEQGRGWMMYPYYEYFNLTIYLDDGNGNNVSCKTQVNVTMPINGLPVRPMIHLNGTTSTLIDPADTVYVVANSSDPEGESLTWTYIFKDDLGEIYRTVVAHTPATEPDENVWVNISHSFGTEGCHRIDVYASDALVPYQTWPHNSSNAIYVYVAVNSAPHTGQVNVNPGYPIMNTTLGYVLVNFSLEAYDSDGDGLNVTWDFGDGLPGAWNETPTGMPGTPTMFRQVRSYTDTGIFNVTVMVTDGRPDHEVVTYRLLTISSGNLPPILSHISLSFAESRSYAFVGEEVVVTAVFTDLEEDPLELEWDFGDGTSKVLVTLTDYDECSVTATVMHVYSAAETYYTLTINYTDNELFGVLNHEKHFEMLIDVRVDDELPVARAGDDQIVEAGWIVFFDGTASSDNWGIDNYTWTLTHNGTEERLWGPTPFVQFWTLGTYVVTLEVTDYAGNKATTTVTVEVVEEIPEFGSTVSVTVALMLGLFLMAFIRRRRRM